MVPEAPELAIRAVAERYCKDGEGQGKARYRWAMDQIAGDYLFVCPVAEVARIIKEIGVSGRQWHPYNPTKQNFFRIGLEPPQVKETAPAHRCTFLATLLT
ncbi:hypothetical protein UY3_15031 [Chelonia mydas]|uniref:Uncharacterized protein n=1 Tax=Chelonia mydas TaxID=8469 RepID=M7AT66_CHEMY|nr:hypothetical protein UY3_15031 [Chelonia mydas]